MSHITRYKHLVDTLSAMRYLGDTLDSSYHAALYLMSSHPDLTEKVARYFSSDGINFTALKEKELFDGAWMKTVADVAHNLFSWNSECAATPFELSRLPMPYLQMVYNAILIANGSYKVRAEQSEQGQDVLVLDDTTLRRNTAMLEWLSASEF